MEAARDLTRQPPPARPWLALFDRFLNEFVRYGTLDIAFPGGIVRRYGSGAPPRAALSVSDRDLPRRLVLSPELALGEGYMDEAYRIEGDDLHGLFHILLRNRHRNPGWALRVNLALRKARRRLDQANPIGRAQTHVAHHYDLDGRLYDLFLDADRQYSCAYFPDPAMTLEAAQAAKKRHIARKLCLAPGQRVLDIGCGWGGMAITLAREFGVRVVGVTLSREQQAHAARRVAEAGLADRVDIRLQDYRAVTETFDRIVSVGMFEHVGAPHYGEYFGRIHDLLAPEGVALVHTIGSAAQRSSTSPWIARYIFPGGYVPSMSEVFGPLERARLWCTDMEVWRLHYARTLRHWFDRFSARRDEAIALYDARFYRMWRFYLAAAEMTFRDGLQAVYQLQLAHHQQAVPLTRDYLYRD